MWKSVHHQKHLFISKIVYVYTTIHNSMFFFSSMGNMADIFIYIIAPEIWQKNIGKFARKKTSPRECSNEIEHRI